MKKRPPLVITPKRTTSSRELFSVGLTWSRVPSDISLGSSRTELLTSIVTGGADADPVFFRLRFALYPISTTTSEELEPRELELKLESKLPVSWIFFSFSFHSALTLGCSHSSALASPFPTPSASSRDICNMPSPYLSSSFPAVSRGQNPGRGNI